MTEALFQTISRWIPNRSRILALGAGDGAWLERLTREKLSLRAEAVETSSELVAACIKRGIVVFQGEPLEGLDQYESGTFDFVLIFHLLENFSDPEVVFTESLRVGRQVVVLYRNFAHFRFRLQLVLQSGHAPFWGPGTPLNLYSILDFRQFCGDLGVTIEKEHFLTNSKPIRFLPNLRAQNALSLCTRRGDRHRPKSVANSDKAGSRVPGLQTRLACWCGRLARTNFVFCPKGERRAKSMLGREPH